MAKKVRVKEQLEIPERVDGATFAASMRRLRVNADFNLLRERWRQLRWRLIDDGKNKPTEAQWSKLAGFDAAVLESEIWAAKDFGGETHNQRAADLARNLA